MLRRPDPFALKEEGGDIRDRNVSGFSWRAFEGTTLGDQPLATLRRVISGRVPSVLGLCVVAALVLLVGRLMYLQGTAGAYLRSVAEGNRIRLESLTPRRGQISDRHGVPLAFTTPSFNLEVLPADLPRDETKRQQLLNSVLNDVPAELIDQENINQLTELSYLPRVVAYDLPHDLAVALAIRVARVPGFSVVVAGERAYLPDPSLGSLVGYVGKLTPQDIKRGRDTYELTDIIGKAGLERQYETKLRGVPGRREVEVDAFGRERKVYAAQEPVPGSDLVLTIDAELQKLAYQLIASSSRGVNGGSVVALDPRTGEVLALVSYPSFDANAFTSQRDTKTITALLQDPRQPLFNRAISGVYPSGSTLKPFLALAGLTEHVITPQTTILSTGGIKVGDRFFADWKQGGHGLVNVYQAIANSVNTFFYLLGGGSADRPGLGISRLASYLSKFHFGVATGIDMAGERAGFIPTPAWKQSIYHDRWYLGDTYNVSIGQGGFTATPLQLAVGYAAIANGGTMMWPHLVHTIQPSGGISEVVQPKIIGQLPVEPAALQVVRDAMRQTVTAGSARSLQSALLPVAGKTGTAQANPSEPTHAWFAGYAPPSAPEIVVLVMLEHGGEGSTVAVPIARQLIDWYAQHPSMSARPSQP